MDLSHSHGGNVSAIDREKSADNLRADTEQQMFTISDRVSKNGGVMDKIIGVAIGSYGVGGLFLGFRESGVKGALWAEQQALQDFMLLIIPLYSLQASLASPLPCQ